MSVDHERPGEDLRARIKRTHGDLPRQQRLVADYFLDHADEVPFLGVPALARRAKVSEATVVRLAQRLGYDGFAELKADLLEIVRRQVCPDTSSGPEAGDLAGRRDDALAEVARQEVENIRATVDHLDRATFRAAVGTLVEADHVYTFGLGISAHLARLFAYMAAHTGQRSSVIPTDFSTPREALVVLRPSDVLVVFSFPKYSRQTVELTRAAIDAGLDTIAVCDRQSAPVGRMVLHTLPARSDNMLFSNSVGAAVTLVNALVTELAMRQRGVAVEAVSAINRMLDDDGDLLP